MVLNIDKSALLIVVLISFGLYFGSMLKWLSDVLNDLFTPKWEKEAKKRAKRVKVLVLED